MNTMKRVISGILGAAVLLIAFVVFVGGHEGRTPTADRPTPTAGAAQGPDFDPEAVQNALAALDTVPVMPTTTAPDYDRELFGDAWVDVDGNGCDTRNDILARDLTVTSMEGDCRILTGVLADPYTGKVIQFVRGEQSSQAVQIDHIVPLSAAWKNGAYAWSTAQRQAFANDPANLRAVDGPANNSTGDRGPARWTPANVGGQAFDCQYAIDYATVLATYDLSAPAEDLDALRGTLALCA